MCKNELVKREDNTPVMSEEQMQFVSVMMQQMLSPVVESIGKILERNNQAMERIAATQQMMTTRISDLEKQVRLKTPLSRAQENYVNNAVRNRARELLEGRGFADDKKAVTKLGGMIRKSILERYGVNSLREAPAYDYETALDQVKFWNNPSAIREVAKEAQKRADMAMEAYEPPAGEDGSAEAVSAAHKPSEQALRAPDNGR